VGVSTANVIEGNVIRMKLPKNISAGRHQAALGVVQEQEIPF
jgi:hypothetical protein